MYVLAFVGVIQDDMDTEPLGRTSYRYGRDGDDPGTSYPTLPVTAITLPLLKEMIVLICDGYKLSTAQVRDAMEVALIGQ